MARRTLAKLRPTFMMTAASAFDRRSMSVASGRVPGMTVRTSSPHVIGALARVQQPDIPVTPGTTSDRVVLFKPAPHVHERAVEERVTLGEKANGESAVELNR